MVFAFLCHSLLSTPCRILYSVVYGEDMQSAVKQVGSLCKPKRSILNCNFHTVECVS